MAVELTGGVVWEIVVEVVGLTVGNALGVTITPVLPGIQ